MSLIKNVDFVEVKTKSYLKGPVIFVTELTNTEIPTQWALYSKSFMPDPKSPLRSDTALSSFFSFRSPPLFLTTSLHSVETRDLV